MRYLMLAAATLATLSGAYACRTQQGAKEYSDLLVADGHVPNDAGLTVRPGFAEFVHPSTLKPFKDALPQIDDAEVDAFVRDPDTMWYDDASMVFAYQDSQETVVGIRANNVGYKVGKANANNNIGRLMHYFQPSGFKFPFATTAGTDGVTNVKVYTLWRPAKKPNGEALPVIYWKTSARGRWRWVFPVGTYFSEVLYQKNPQGQWVCFEVRTRKRYADGWETNLFRPFGTATGMAKAVKELRSDWESKEGLSKLVKHLETPTTLVKTAYGSEPYKKIFAGLKGALDPLPAADDDQLITELLTKTKFKSMEGEIWKQNGALETYGPSSAADYQVVPKNYFGGMIAVNEESCGRCHSETGRRLGELELDVSLYGEVWGEDRIFSWHLFKPHSQFYNTFDETRMPNPRLESAKLIMHAQPPAGGGNAWYKLLPLGYPELQF